MRGTTAKDRDKYSAEPISIHVPREGHDNSNPECYRPLKISIHVPREGHDQLSTPTSFASANFYPRAPGGARPVPGTAGH